MSKVNKLRVVSNINTEVRHYPVPDFNTSMFVMDILAKDFRLIETNSYYELILEQYDAESETWTHWVDENGHSTYYYTIDPDTLEIKFKE